MGTFQKTETVDARQFTGGIENGSDLALWVNSIGQQMEERADWYDRRINNVLTLPERIRLRTYTRWSDVYVGDWIIYRQDGTIDHMRDQDFRAAGYIQV